MFKNTGRVGFLVQFYIWIPNFINIEAVIKNFIFFGGPPPLLNSIKEITWLNNATNRKSVNKWLSWNICKDISSWCTRYKFRIDTKIWPWKLWFLGPKCKKILMKNSNFSFGLDSEKKKHYLRLYKYRSLDIFNYPWLISII